MDGFSRKIDAFAIKFVLPVLDNTTTNGATLLIIPVTIVVATNPTDIPYILRWVGGGFQGQSSDSIPNGSVRNKRAGNTTHERV